MDVESGCNEDGHTFAPVAEQDDGASPEWRNMVCIHCLKLHRSTVQHFFLEERGVDNLAELVESTMEQMRAEEKLDAEKRTGKVPRVGEGAADEPESSVPPEDAELRQLATSRVDSEFNEVLEQRERESRESLEDFRARLAQKDPPVGVCHGASVCSLDAPDTAPSRVSTTEVNPGNLAQAEAQEADSAVPVPAGGQTDDGVGSLPENLRALQLSPAKQLPAPTRTKGRGKV